MYRVLKRDGSMMEFHIAKIGNAITKAFEAVGRQYHPSVIELLALRVTAEFEPKIRNDLISVEDIQDCVERVLSEAGYSDVAKAVILHLVVSFFVCNIHIDSPIYPCHSALSQPE